MRPASETGFSRIRQGPVEREVERMVWTEGDSIEEVYHYGISLLGDTVVWCGRKEKEGGLGKLYQEGKQYMAVESRCFCNKLYYFLKEVTELWILAELNRN